MHSWHSPTCFCVSVSFKHILTNYSKSSLNFSHATKILLIFRLQTYCWREMNWNRRDEDRAYSQPQTVSVYVLHTTNEPAYEGQTTHCPSIKITEWGLPTPSPGAHTPAFTDWPEIRGIYGANMLHLGIWRELFAFGHVHAGSNKLDKKVESYLKKMSFISSIMPAPYKLQSNFCDNIVSYSNLVLIYYYFDWTLTL